MPRTILASPEPPEPSPHDRDAGHWPWVGHRAEPAPERLDATPLHLTVQDRAVLDFLAGEYASVPLTDARPADQDQPTVFVPLDIPSVAIVAVRRGFRLGGPFDRRHLPGRRGG